MSSIPWLRAWRRTGAPSIEGNLVIVNAISTNWGREGPARNRFYAFHYLLPFASRMRSMASWSPDPDADDSLLIAFCHGRLEEMSLAAAHFKNLEMAIFHGNAELGDYALQIAGLTMLETGEGEEAFFRLREAVATQSEDSKDMIREASIRCCRQALSNRTISAAKSRRWRQRLAILSPDDLVNDRRLLALVYADAVRRDLPSDCLNPANDMHEAKETRK